MYKEYYRNNLTLIIADFCLTLLTLVGAAFLRPYLPGEELGAADVIPHNSIYILTPLSLSVVFAIAGVYNFRTIPSLTIQLRSLVFSYAVWGWFLVGALYLTFRETSRLLMVYFALSNFLVLAFSRYYMWKYLAPVENGASAARVIILGSIDSSTKICDLVLKGLPAGHQLIGISDFQEPEILPVGVQFLGTADALPEIVQNHRIDIVIVSLDHASLPDVSQLVTDLIRIPVRVLLAQDYSALPFLALDIERIGDLVLVGLMEPVITGWNRLLKRFFDIAFSSLALLVTAPVFVIIALAIKLESPGPVIFRTKRIGDAGKTFTMYKFRSMIEGAPDFLDTVPVLDIKSRPIYKLKDDPRITRVGRFLRRWSLDELPQLINVLKGDMSMVGPRPEQPFITKQYEPWQWQRIQVPPGITGWWQVHGRSELPMHLNTQLDIYYVANYSMILDIKILFLTIFEVIKGRGAY